MSNALAVYNAHYGESHEAGLAAVWKAGAESVAAAVVEAGPNLEQELQASVHARDKRVLALQEELDTTSSQLASARKEWEAERTSLQNEITKVSDELTKAKQAQVVAKVPKAKEEEEEEEEKQTITKDDVGNLTKVAGTAGSN